MGKGAIEAKGGKMRQNITPSIGGKSNVNKEGVCFRAKRLILACKNSGNERSKVARKALLCIAIKQWLPLENRLANVQFSTHADRC